jgi:hypothetical protein
VSEVLDRARDAGRKRRSPIRAGAVPAKVMIELARHHGVAGDAVVRQELARYVAQVRVNGWTMRRSALTGGRLTGADGSIAKLTTARICQQSRDLSYRIVGAAGMLMGSRSPLEGDLQLVNLASPGNRLGGGTDEIQLNVLGERALGLPREPSGNKDVPYRDLHVGTQAQSASHGAVKVSEVPLVGSACPRIRISAFDNAFMRIYADPPDRLCRCCMRSNMALAAFA